MQLRDSRRAAEDLANELDVVDVGVRVLGDSRAQDDELQTPVVKLRGDWEGAREVDGHVRQARPREFIHVPRFEYRLQHG